MKWEKAMASAQQVAMYHTSRAFVYGRFIYGRWDYQVTRLPERAERLRALAVKFR